MDAVWAPVLASLVWSLNPAAVSRWARRASPMFFTAVRGVVALAVVGVAYPVLGVFGFEPSAGVFSLVPLLLVFASALAGPAVGDAAYVRAIQVLGGSLAVVVSYTYVFFAQLFSYILGIEAPNPWMVAGGSTAFLGVVVAAYQPGAKVSPVGVVYGFIAAVCWGIATVTIKLVEGYMDPVSLSAVRLAMVVAVLTLLSLLAGEDRSVDSGFLKAATITGGLGWGVGMILFVYSIYAIGPSATAIATSLTPPLSQMTSRIVAGEKASARNILGALLVGLGIALTYAPRLLGR